MSLPKFEFINAVNDQESVEGRWDRWVMRFQNYLIAFAITEEETKLEHFFQLAGNQIHELYNTVNHTSPDDDVKESHLDQAIRVLTTHFNKESRQQFQEVSIIEAKQIKVRAKSSNNQEGCEPSSNQKRCEPSSNQKGCEPKCDQERCEPISNQKVPESIKCSHQVIQCHQEVSENVKTHDQVIQQRQTVRRLRDRCSNYFSPECSIHQDEQRNQRQQTRRVHRNQSGFLPADFIQYINDHHNTSSVNKDQHQVNQQSTREKGSLNIQSSTNSTAMTEIAEADDLSSMRRPIKATPNNGANSNAVIKSSFHISRDQVKFQTGVQSFVSNPASAFAQRERAFAPITSNSDRASSATM